MAFEPAKYIVRVVAKQKQKKPYTFLRKAFKVVEARYELSNFLQDLQRIDNLPIPNHVSDSSTEQKRNRNISPSKKVRGKNTTARGGTIPQKRPQGSALNKRQIR